MELPHHSEINELHIKFYRTERPGRLVSLFLHYMAKSWQCGNLILVEGISFTLPGLSCIIEKDRKTSVRHR